MMRDTEARLLIAHSVEPGDPRLAQALVNETPDRVWQRIEDGVAVPEVWHMNARSAPARVERSLARAEASALRWVTPTHAQWPRQLDDLARFEGINGVAGAPVGLWIGGEPSFAECTQRALGIVGARNCTTYGAEMAAELAADCADAGFSIVSGAAFGIDAAAHRGALSLMYPTISVMACGADIDYPRAHASLLSRILDTGLIVSEYPPGEPPQRHRFLARNRIIAALCQGVVVIEAARRSGSLNTLHWADQLGRTTMGVPGPVTSQASTGVHAAIRDGKAILVTQGNEVLLELGALESAGVD